MRTLSARSVAMRVTDGPGRRDPVDELGRRRHGRWRRGRAPRPARRGRCRGACRTAARSGRSAAPSPAAGRRRSRRRRCRRRRSRRSTSRAASAVSAPASWTKAMSPTRATVGDAPQRHAERRRDDAVDAVGAAVGVSPGRRGRRTTRGRAPASTRRRPARRRRAGHGPRCGRRRLAERRLRPEHGVDRRLGALVGVDPPLPPRRDRRRRRAPGRAGRARSTPAGDRRVVGIDRRRHRRPARAVAPDAGDPLGEHLATPPDGRRGRSTSGRRRREPSRRGGAARRRRRRRRGRARNRDVGSARTGQPVAATNASRRLRRRADRRRARRPAAVERAARRARRATSGVAGRARLAAPDRRGGSGPGVADERLAERQVEVHRPVVGRPRRGAVRASATSTPRRRRRHPGRGTSGRPGRTGCVWSIVCGAPTSRSSAGRSAVSTSIGTPDSAGLDDRRVQVGRRRAARAQHDRRRARQPEAEGDEAGDALVVDDVHRRARPGRPGRAASACSASPGRRRRGGRPGRSARRPASRRTSPGPGSRRVTIRQRRARAGRVMACSSRCGPTSSARGATSASGGWPRRWPSSTPTTFDTPIESSTARSSSTRRRRRGPTMPVAEAYARKFGGPEQARRSSTTSPTSPPSEGSTFHLDRALRANTRDAHRLLWYAEQHGGAGTQADVKERLLAAYFVDGRERRRSRRARRRRHQRRSRRRRRAPVPRRRRGRRRARRVARRSPRTPASPPSRRT